MSWGSDMGSRRKRKLRIRLSEAQNHRCCYCGCRMVETPDLIPRRATIEHVVPKWQGGRTNWENCVAACKRCNEAEGARNAPGWGYRPKRMRFAASAAQKNFRMAVTEISRFPGGDGTP